MVRMWLQKLLYNESQMRDALKVHYNWLSFSLNELYVIRYTYAIHEHMRFITKGKWFANSMLLLRSSYCISGFECWYQLGSNYSVKFIAAVGIINRSCDPLLLCMIYVCDSTKQIRYGPHNKPGTRLNIKTVFPRYGIPTLKIRRSRNRLVSYIRVYETSAGCRRSIYPSLGMRQLFGDATMGRDVTINRPN